MSKRPLLLLCLLVTLMSAASRPAAAQQIEMLCFAETGQCIEGRFLSYWRANGGLAVFGYPISEARSEVNRDTGSAYLTQWFERYRFELHPENAAPYDVLLGRLGSELSEGGVPWTGSAPVEEAGCLTFAVTPYTICDSAAFLPVGFRTFWEGHGLKDPAMSRQQQSLALFGYPVSPVFTYYNPNGDFVYAQYFERARFEAHMTDAGMIVLLGHLAKEKRAPQTVWQTVRNRIPQEIAVYEPHALPGEHKAPVIYALEEDANSYDGVSYTLVYEDLHSLPGYDGLAFILGTGYQGWDAASPLNPEPVEVRGVQGVLSVGIPGDPAAVMVQWEERGQTYRIVDNGPQASRATMLTIIGGLQPVR